MKETRAIRWCRGQNRLINLVLVFALVLAVVHVALHDPAVDGELDHQCQVCRLSQTPAASPAALSPPAFLQSFVYVISIHEAEHPHTRSPRARRARAPPLS